MDTDLRESKKQLRKSVSALLKALPSSYRSAASERIQERVLSLPEYAGAESIFVYVNMPTEPETARIIAQAVADGKRLYVPKCIGKGEMLAVRIRSTEQLRPGAYGIPEPVDCSETVEPEALDLIVVPCVSASADGRRLGHGAGFYDRFLERSEGKTVCLCFAKVMRSDIPVGEHDARMHRVISEE